MMRLNHSETSTRCAYFSSSSDRFISGSTARRTLSVSTPLFSLGTSAWFIEALNMISYFTVNITSRNTGYYQTKGFYCLKGQRLRLWSGDTREHWGINREPKGEPNFCSFPTLSRKR